MFSDIKQKLWVIEFQKKLPAIKVLLYKMIIFTRSCHFFFVLSHYVALVIQNKRQPE